MDGQFGLDDFQRDQTFQFAVHGFVDSAHAAFAEHLHDFVARAQQRARGNFAARK